MKTKKPIEINLEGIEIKELSVFLQEGAKGIPEFAASCHCSCACSSCTGVDAA